MPFQKVVPEKLAGSVVRQIELLILRGILRPGERLPPERDLADRMGISRPSLREALADLQENGLLETRAGSGIFVADVLRSAFSPALVRLFSEYDEAVLDYLAFRRDIEGLAIVRAVREGSDTDLAVVNRVFQRMESSHKKPNPEKEARIDAEFHLAIIEASHNLVLVHMMRAMFDFLQEGVFFNREKMFQQRTTRKQLLDQHRTINEALLARDEIAARDAIHAHLDYVETALLMQQKAESNEVIANQRIALEKEKGSGL